MGTTVTSSVPVKPGDCQQVVGTWDGVDIRIYVDGSRGRQGRADQAAAARSDLLRRLRRARPGSTASIDEVAYYGTALPAARVFQHLLADPPPGDLDPAPDDPTDPPVDPEDPPVDPEDPRRSRGPAR